jgi:cell division protein YceG involved in septum cleavage
LIRKSELKLEVKFEGEKMDKKAVQTPKKNNPRKKKRVLFWLSMLLLFAGITFLGGVFSYNYVMKNYAETSNKEALVIDPKDGVEFIINRGAKTAEITKNLMDQGFIKNENIFKLMSKIKICMILNILL